MIRIIALLILIIGLGAGLYLVQHPQIFNPKAVFVDETGGWPNYEKGGRLEKGFQIDASDPEKIPSPNMFKALRPKWVRFVYFADVGIPQDIPPDVKILLIFNNQANKLLKGTPPPKGLDPRFDAWKDRFNDDDIKAWKDYADQKFLPALEDFLKSGQRVDAIQIFNEPDGCGIATSDCLPPVSYAYMLKKSAEKIKSYNPNIKVITAGFTWSWNYIKELKERDPEVFAQVDAIGLHPYWLYPDDSSSPDGWCKGKTDENGKPLNQPYDNDDSRYAECGNHVLPAGGLEWVIDQYQQLFGLPIWITEIGISTDDENWQAKYFGKIFRIFNEKRIKVAIWYGWTDKMLGGNDERSMGLVTAGEAIKAVGTAFLEFGEE